MMPILIKETLKKDFTAKSNIRFNKYSRINARLKLIAQKTMRIVYGLAPNL